MPIFNGRCVAFVTSVTATEEQLFMLNGVIIELAQGALSTPPSVPFLNHCRAFAHLSSEERETFKKCLFIWNRYFIAGRYPHPISDLFFSIQEFLGFSSSSSTCRSLQIEEINLLAHAGENITRVERAHFAFASLKEYYDALLTDQRAPIAIVVTDGLKRVRDQRAFLDQMGALLTNGGSMDISAWAGFGKWALHVDKNYLVRLTFEGSLKPLLTAAKAATTAHFATINHQLPDWGKGFLLAPRVEYTIRCGQASFSFMLFVPSEDARNDIYGRLEAAKNEGKAFDLAPFVHWWADCHILLKEVQGAVVWEWAKSAGKDGEPLMCRMEGEPEFTKIGPGWSARVKPGVPLIFKGGNKTLLFTINSYGHPVIISLP